MRGRSWTVEEEEQLTKLWNSTSFTYEQIGRELGRSYGSVDHRIRKLRKTGLLGYRNPNIIKNKYKKDLTNVIDLTSCGAYFITSVLCDGHLRERKVHFKFRKRDCSEFRAIMCHILNITPPLNIYWVKSRFINWGKWKRKRIPYGSYGEIQIYSTALAKLLAYTYGVPMGQKSGLVRLPRHIMKSADPKLHGAVLRAAYECEGSVNLHDKDLSITIGNSSMLFLQDLSEILEKYKIDHNIYDIRLKISSPDSVLKFYEMVYSVFDLNLHVIAKKKGLETLIKLKAKKRPYKRRNAQ